MTVRSTIRVGVLHSSSGTMAADEKHLAAAAHMAVDEINEAGGVLGKQVEVVFRDGASDPAIFADKARELLAQEEVRTIFGCWMSSARKAVKPIVEEHNSLLWYPVQYEGLEQSSNIIYTGSCLNQQIEPAVTWALSQGKRRCFLVGSDYVFPRTANSLIRALASQGGGCVISEQYVPLGSDNLAEVANAIAKARPDIVFNTINGDSNLAFFREFNRAVGDAGDCPIMSFSLAESSLGEVRRESAGHYACWSYFQQLRTPENGRFLDKYSRRFGPDAVVDDPMATAYTQVYPWKQAVERARSFDISEILDNVVGCSVAGPGGAMEVQANHHVKKLALIGQATGQGRFDVVWSSEHPIDPKPWLGVEDAELPTRGLVLEALRQYPEVINLNVELEDRVRERTAELERANEALEAEIADRKEVEKKLRESEERYWAIVVDMPALVCRSLPGGEITFVNEAYCKYFDKTSEELVGSNYLSLIPEVDRQSVMANISALTVESPTQSHEHRVIAPNGEIRWQRWTTRAVFDAEGRAVVHQDVGEDITERKLIEEALHRLNQQLRTSIDQMPIAYILWDNAFRVVEWNASAERVFGYSKSEMLGEYPLDYIVSEPARPLVHEVIEKLLNGEEADYSGDGNNIRKDGAVISCRWYNTPLKDETGTTVAVLSMAIDITERKEAEEEREDLITKLEAQNAELERFAYTVSHDLKSPLITIKGYVGVLRQDMAEGRSETAGDDLARISNAADKMSQLLEDLLELSRVGRLANPPEDVPLEELAREALELVAGQVKQIGVQVDISPGLPVVFGDRVRLREVMQNLIDNAVKYMGDQSRPQVEIGSRRDGNDLVCYVRDNGIGIEPRYHEKVFGLFDQLDQKVEGSGIGLALVKRIVEVHGGRIWVESEGLGHGAAFCFTIAARNEST